MGYASILYHAAPLALLIIAPIEGVSQRDVRYGGDYVRMCESDVLDLRKSCLLYTQGLIDGIGVEQASKGDRALCYPDVTLSHLIAVTVEYIKASPGRAGFHTSSLFMAAINARYPC